MSCFNFQVRLWWTVSLLNREKFFFNPHKPHWIPIQVTRGMKLEVEGIRAAVTVAVVTAKQKCLSFF